MKYISVHWRAVSEDEDELIIDETEICLGIVQKYHGGYLSYVYGPGQRFTRVPGQDLFGTKSHANAKQVVEAELHAGIAV
jgi:hypothetical protein